MEHFHITTVYDFMHKNHNFIKSDHISLIKYILKLSCTPKGHVHPWLGTTDLQSQTVQEQWLELLESED